MGTTATIMVEMIIATLRKTFADLDMAEPLTKKRVVEGLLSAAHAAAFHSGLTDEDVKKEVDDAWAAHRDVQDAHQQPPS